MTYDHEATMKSVMVLAIAPLAVKVARDIASWLRDRAYGDIPARLDKWRKERAT